MTSNNNDEIHINYINHNNISQIKYKKTFMFKCQQKANNAMKCLG